MTYDEEIWLPAKNFEGYYEASTFGRIRTVNRSNMHSSAELNIFKRSQVIKPDDNRSDHYYTVTLYKNNKSYTLLLHKIIAQTFVPNPNNYAIINHVDGDRHNNFVHNLKWCEELSKSRTRAIYKKVGNVKLTIARLGDKSKSDVTENTESNSIKSVKLTATENIESEPASLSIEPFNVGVSVPVEPEEVVITTQPVKIVEAEPADQKVKTYILCVEDELGFKSYEAAGRYYGITGGTVSESVKNNKTTRSGKTFKRVPEEEITKWG